MNIDLRQLYDNDSDFYPMTCMEAVFTGLALGSDYIETDLSDHLSSNYTGNFKSYTYENILYMYDLDIAIGDGVDPLADNIIAEEINLVNGPYLFKTITDDNSCKATVILDVDQKLKLCIIPQTKIDIVDGVVTKTIVSNVSKIKATLIAVVAES